MVGSVARSRVAGLVAGIAVVATAAFAHVRAGGSLDATTSVPLMLGLVGAAAGLAPSLRWTFGRLIVASLAAQAMLHVASGLASPQAQLASGSHHHTHSTAMHAVWMLPAPPYSAGALDTRKPAAPALSHNSRGTLPSFSHL